MSMAFPETEDISLSDIVHSMAITMPGLGGSPRYFYSMAQHAVIGSHIAEMQYGREVARAYLFTIAPQIYTGVVSPAVRAILPLLSQFDENIGRKMFEHFGIDDDLWLCEEIKNVRDQMRAIEYRDLLPEALVVGSDSNADIVINSMNPYQAYQTFSERFRELFPERLSEIILHEAKSMKDLSEALGWTGTSCPQQCPISLAAVH